MKPSPEHSQILRSTRTGLVIVIVIGVVWRLVRYFLQMPLWGDEAALGMNILERNFGGLLAPLDYAQVAPILFLWAEKLALLSLGSSEMAMRLLPLLAGLCGLFLFYQLAHRVSEPLPAALATTLLAVSYFTVRHTVELKPYSFDLLASTALLLSAVLYLQTKHRRALIAWGLVAPVAVLISYPAVFVFGATALILLTKMRSARKPERGIWLGGFLLGGLAFFWMLHAVSSKQFTALETPMTTYWKNSFPPHDLWRAPFWFLKINAGTMMAYPVGGKNWASTSTLLLGLIGAAWAWKKWPRELLLLIILPFLLTLAAAALHRYPYGGSARIAQHLAPGICLLAGLGAGWLVELQPNLKLRRLGVRIIFALLAIIGLAGIVRDCLKPAKTPGDATARQYVREWLAPQANTRTWVVWEPMRDLAPNFQWYLRSSGKPITWDGRSNRSWAGTPGPITVLSFDPNPRLGESVAAKFPQLTLTASKSEHILVGPPELGPSTWTALRFEKGPLPTAE